MKRTYPELDGLRGVAALSVALMHRGGLFGPGADAMYGGSQAWLAVDFFLLLSGFVIAHAYEDRLRESGSVRAFLRARIIRLHPLLVLGAVSGAVTLMLADPAVTPAAALVYAVAGAVPWPLPGDGCAFPADFPTWSIFWELVLNLGFALAVPFLTTRRLIAAIGASALAMVVIAAHRHTVDMGNGIGRLIEAGPRLATSFLLGVALLRAHHAGVLAEGGRRWWLAPLLVACFFAAPKGLAFQLTAILLIFPLVVLAAAGSRPIVPALAALSGAISYPLYILHVPLARIARACLPDGPVLGSVYFATLLLLSYAVWRWYDVPVRRRCAALAKQAVSARAPDAPARWRAGRRRAAW